MISLLLVCLVCGFIAWLVQTQAPITPAFKQIISFVLVVICLLYALSVFGVLPRTVYGRW